MSQINSWLSLLKLIAEQKEICKKYRAPYLETPLELKVGIARNVSGKVYPINGLRHNPTSDTTGWYIWV